MHFTCLNLLKYKTDAFFKEVKLRVNKTKLSKICLISFPTISIDASIFLLPGILWYENAESSAIISVY